VTPSDVKNLISEAKKLETYAYTIFSSAIIIASLSLLNFGVIFLRKKRVFKRRTVKKIYQVRFILTILLSIICGICIILMFLVSNSTTIAYLSENSCSSDSVLNDSFILMNTYYTKLNPKNWATLSFILAIVGIDLGLAGINAYIKY